MKPITHLNPPQVMPYFGMKIATEATKKIVPEEILGPLVMFSALRKPLQPEDLTGTAVFLACEDSDMMTGQVLVVDGGMIMLG